MSNEHDDTPASVPGQLPLSMARLEELEPELFTERTFECAPWCTVDHPAAHMRERFQKHLELGWCCPAKVVSLAPLVVAVQADDLDAVVLLSFPPALIARYGLDLGTRLLAVNTYVDLRAGDAGPQVFAVDLVPGPEHTNRCSNYHPLIADFVCDDRALVDERKRQLAESAWESVDTLARVRIASFGLDTARSGKPTRAGWPVRTFGSDHFAPHEVLARAAEDGAPRRGPVVAIVAIAAVVAIAAILSLFT